MKEMSILSIGNEEYEVVDDKARVYVNVKEFGAIGDGIHDDTLAIQSAIDTGLSVIVPDGTYRITDTIHIKHTGITFKGCSYKTVFLYEGEGIAFNVEAVNPTKADDWLRIQLKNFEIKNNTNGTIGLRINQCIGSMFEDIYVTNFSLYNIFIDGTETLTEIGNNSTFNNRYHNIKAKDGGIGLYVNGIISDSYFDELIFSQCGDGIVFDGDKKLTNHNISLNNISVVESKGSCIRTTETVYMSNIRISGCNFEQYTDYGIYFVSNTTGMQCLSVTNSSFLSKATSKQGIYIKGFSCGDIRNIFFAGTKAEKDIYIDGTNNFIYGIKASGSRGFGEVEISKFSHKFEYRYKGSLDVMSVNVPVHSQNFVSDNGLRVINDGGFTDIKSTNNSLVTVRNNGTTPMVIGGYYTTEERNALDCYYGSYVYDTTLHKPVFKCSTGKWVDATGAQV